MDDDEEKTMWRPRLGSIYSVLIMMKGMSSMEQVESEELGLKCFTLME